MKLLDTLFCGMVCFCFSFSCAFWNNWWASLWSKICFVSFQPFYLYWDLLYDPEEWKGSFFCKGGDCKHFRVCKPGNASVMYSLWFVLVYLGQPFKNIKTTLRSWTMQTQAMWPQWSNQMVGQPWFLALCVLGRSGGLCCRWMFCQRPSGRAGLQSASLLYLSWAGCVCLFFLSFERISTIFVDWTLSPVWFVSCIFKVSTYFTAWPLEEWLSNWFVELNVIDVFAVGRFTNNTLSDSKLTHPVFSLQFFQGNGEDILMEAQFSHV